MEDRDRVRAECELRRVASEEHKAEGHQHANDRDDHEEWAIRCYRAR